jgi:hypothetical protein
MSERKPSVSETEAAEEADRLDMSREDSRQSARRHRMSDEAEYAAEIAAAVADTEAAEVAERTSRRKIGSLQTIMLVLLGVSLLIHALTLTQLFRVRNTLRSEIDQLATNVAAARNQQVRYDLPINQQIPINIDVPIKRSMNIPIQTEVRIQQQINVPVDTLVAGTVNIPIPIDTTVPISTTVPIDFDQSVNISTTVPLQLNVPVQIDLGSPQIAGYLDRIYQALIELREEL